MGFKKTGYTEKTAENYLLDSATIYTNVTVTAGEWSYEKLIGATQGGASVSLEQTWRYPEVDGTAHVQGKVKGNAVLESAIAMATIPLKEIDAENLKMSLNGAMVDALATEAPSGYKKITTKRYLESTDYIGNIGIVWHDPKDNKPTVIILDNVLSTGAIELKGEDNGEVVIELNLEAHSSVEQLSTDAFPWRIFKKATAV